MRKHKILVFLLTVILAVALIAGCAGQKQDQTEEVVHKVAVLMDEETPPLAEEVPKTEFDTNDVNELDITDTEDDVNELDIVDTDDNINDSVHWMSYVMSFEITEEGPPAGDTTPDGKFVHVTLTYISDDEELGGFLFEDIKEKSNFVLIDTSGNVYEHLDIFSPVSINMSDGVFEAEEIQDVTGVYFDIPPDIQLSDLTFSVTG